jgi:hypothetical protein
VRVDRRAEVVAMMMAQLVGDDHLGSVAPDEGRQFPIVDDDLISTDDRGEGVLSQIGVQWVDEALVLHVEADRVADVEEHVHVIFERRIRGDDMVANRKVDGRRLVEIDVEAVLLGEGRA